MSYVSENVRAALFFKRIKCKDAAEQLGVRPSTFSHKLNGISPFSIEEIIAVHELTGVSYDELFKKGNVA